MKKIIPADAHVIQDLERGLFRDCALSIIEGTIFIAAILMKSSFNRLACFSSSFAFARCFVCYTVRANFTCL